MISIVDTGGANLASVVNALERLGVSARFTRNPEEIAKSDRILLPGVGAARDAMNRLESSGSIEVIRQFKRPILGICLGMQILFDESEEGETPCLRLLPGRVTQVKEKLENQQFSVPHMGWNSVSRSKSNSQLLNAEAEFFYFVHSFRIPEGDFVTGSCEYSETIPSVIERGNLYGVQFHPERSGAAGAHLLERFFKVSASC